MIKIHPDVMVANTATIDVKDGEIGRGTIIEHGAVLKGRYIKIGQESWIGEYASIGGGSCFDTKAFLEAGDWLHLGPYAHINTARGVTIGNEVGIGWKSSVFTHGAYLPVDMGFPVQWEGVKIGDRVWLPNAWVNPGVTIGDDVVVSAMSLINRDLPSGCLAGGIPVKILKENEYPHKPDGSVMSKLFKDISRLVAQTFRTDAAISFSEEEIHLVFQEKLTVFNLKGRWIMGSANGASEVVKEQLRRNGIRFRYAYYQGRYIEWEELEEAD